MIVTRVFCGALWLLFVRANDKDPSLMVYDGTEASPGMFPSIGVLDLESEGGQNFTCGATLIDSEWAVSAAHCFYDETKPMKFRIKRITFGDVTPYGAGSPRQESAFNFSIHKRYKPKKDRYDIALLHLENPVENTKYVAPIEISSSSHEENTHSNCQVAGWGLKGPELETNKLLYADIQLQDSKKCKKAYGRFFRRRTMLCAGSDTSDACEVRYFYLLHLEYFIISCKLSKVFGLGILRLWMLPLQLVPFTEPMDLTIAPTLKEKRSSAIAILRFKAFFYDPHPWIHERL